MSLVDEALVAQLLLRRLGLIETVDLHASEHSWRLGELDLTVVNDLNRLPQGSRKSSDPDDCTPIPASCIAARTASLSSTTRPKCRAPSCGCVRPAASAMNWSPRSMKPILLPADPQLELEEAPVPTQRLVEVADLKRYVVDPNNPCHRCSHPSAWRTRCLSAIGPTPQLRSPSILMLRPDHSGLVGASGVEFPAGRKPGLTPRMAGCRLLAPGRAPAGELGIQAAVSADLSVQGAAAPCLPVAASWGFTYGFSSSSLVMLTAVFAAIEPRGPAPWLLQPQATKPRMTRLRTSRNRPTC